jgi:apolipoprotein N-acyltransferase
MSCSVKISSRRNVDEAPREGRLVQFVARTAIAAVAGVITALAFAPAGLWPLALLGVVGVLAAQWRVGPAIGAALGFVYGATFFLVLLSWMTVIGTDAWILLSLYCALWNGALGAATGPLSRVRGSAVWIASGWVVMEALRGRVPLGGFPWGELAFSQGNSPLAPLTGVAGMAGLSFLIVALAAIIVDSIRRRRIRAVGILTVATVLAIVFIPKPLEFGGSSGNTTVAVVQGGTPGTGMDAMSVRRAVLANHVEQTLRLANAVAEGEVAQPDFVLWPENSSDIDPFRDPSAAAEIDRAAQAIGVPIVVGVVVQTDDPTKVENTGVVWDPQTGPGERYVKNHPVPFGEFVPFREQLSGLIGRFDRVPRDFVPGTEAGVLDAGGVVIGDVICFEVAYDDVFSAVVDGGAEMITVQTNNATYQGTGQPAQQWDIELLRALQSGRSVAVASTTGVSGIIEPDGTVVAELAEGETGYLVAEVPLRDGQTLSTYLDSIPEYLAALALLAGLVISVYVRRRSAAATRELDRPLG